MILKNITIFFSILPLIAAFFDKSFFKYVPFFILIILYLVIITVKQKIYKIPISFFFIILITLIHLLIQLTLGSGYGSGGIILLLLETFLIFQLINLNKKIDFDGVISFFLTFSLFICISNFLFEYLAMNLYL